MKQPKDNTFKDKKELILELLSDLIFIASVDGYFKYVNPAWEKILGYTEEELLTKPFLDFIHPDDYNMSNKEVEQLGQGYETVEFENRIIHKNGEIKYVSWKAKAIPDKKDIYCIGRDVTKNKKLESHKNELFKELECFYKM